MQASRAGFLLAVCLLTVSCGGGGGGGGGGGSGSSQSGIPFDYSGVPADLQTEDPVRVAASVLRGINEITALASTTNGGILSSAVAKPKYLWSFVLDAYRQHNAETMQQGVTLPAISVGPETDNCTFGGSVTVSANIADPDLFLGGILSVGDRFFADYSNCNDEGGETLDGGFDFEILSFNGNFYDPEYDLGVALDLARLRFTNFRTSVLFDGSVELIMTLLDGPDITTITGDSLIYESDGVTYALSNFSEVLTLDGLTGTTAGAGVMESTLVTGELEYSILTPLLSSPDNSGQVLVLGANAGSMLITQLSDDLTLRLEIDVDGIDGNETTLDVTWEQLHAAVPD